jgi:hypothetical protein
MRVIQHFRPTVFGSRLGKCEGHGRRKRNQYSAGMRCPRRHGEEARKMFPGYAVYESTNTHSSNYSLVDRKEWAVLWKSNRPLTPDMEHVRKAQHLNLKHSASGIIVTVLFTKHHVGTRGNGCQWDADARDTSWTSIGEALPQIGFWIVAGNLATPTQDVPKGSSKLWPKHLATRSDSLHALLWWAG